jgi:hypothetical protein
VNRIYVYPDTLSSANRIGKELVDNMSQKVPSEVRLRLNGFLQIHSDAYGSAGVDEARERLRVVAAAADFDETKYAELGEKLTKFMSVVDSVAAQFLGMDSSVRF